MSQLIEQWFGSRFELSDVIALIIFLFTWAGYALAADRISRKQHNLLSVMDRYRILWMREMLKRDNRMMDAAMVGNLLRSISFFASTTIFILLGLMTLLRYQEEAARLLGDIPFAQASSVFLWEFKVFLLIMIFIYAFFKYTWSLRQYNYTCIFIAAAPAAGESTEHYEDYAQKGAKLANSAAKHFNLGLRAYYFGMAAIGWFINSWALIVATAWVVLVLYRREFRSHTLNHLSEASILAGK